MISFSHGVEDYVLLTVSPWPSFFFFLIVKASTGILWSKAARREKPSRKTLRVRIYWNFSISRNRYPYFSKPISRYLEIKILNVYLLNDKRIDLLWFVFSKLRIRSYEPCEPLYPPLLASVLFISATDKLMVRITTRQLKCEGFIRRTSRTWWAMQEV